MFNCIIGDWGQSEAERTIESKKRLTEPERAKESQNQREPERTRESQRESQREPKRARESHKLQINDWRLKLQYVVGIFIANISNYAIVLQ